MHVEGSRTRRAFCRKKKYLRLDDFSFLPFFHHMKYRYLFISGFIEIDGILKFKMVRRNKLK
jgi:hypothetical protein